MINKINLVIPSCFICAIWIQLVLYTGYRKCTKPCTIIDMWITGDSIIFKRFGGGCLRVETAGVMGFILSPTVNGKWKE